MKNTLGDLNNHLFAEMERLSNEDLSAEELVTEISRAKAVAQVATQIIQNGSLALKAKIAYDEQFGGNTKLPPMLEG